MYRLQELVRLHREGISARRIAQQLKMSRNTVRQYREALTAAGLLEGEPAVLPEEAVLQAAVQQALPPAEPPQQVSSVEDWSDDIARLQRTGSNPKAIHDWLRLERGGYKGSYEAIKRRVRRLKKGCPPSSKDVVIPVQTRPGQVAQVDFGFVGWLPDPVTGKLRRVWVFVLVLGHSRHMFADLVFDQSIGTWQRLHAAAFAFFGGVPAVLVPDNLKAAVIRAAFTSGDEAELNRSYVELARYYGFQVDPTPPRSPEKKGKVESGVKYVQRSFWKPREDSLSSIEEARAALQRWVLAVAGERIHGTTQKRPLAVFEAEEKPALRPLPQMPFAPVIWKRVKVHRDSHVQFSQALYSVPWRLCGSPLWVRAVGETVELRDETSRIATHPKQKPGGRSTLRGHLPPEREAWSFRDRPYWEERAAKLGEDVLTLVAEIFEADHVQLQLRKVQAIVTHLERFPPERAQAAARRASFYQSFGVRAMKDMLRQGLDTEPLPGTLVPSHGHLERPRFARSPPVVTPTPTPEA